MQIQKYIFFSLYILLIVCNIVYTDLPLFGSITYRHVSTIGLILFLFTQEGANLKPDKYFAIFFVYVFFWGVGAISTGYGSQFVNKFFGTTLSAFAAYQSTKFLINKYDSLHVLIIILLVIGYIDSLCTILQFYHQPVGYSIPQLLNIDFISDFEEYAERRYSAGDTAFTIQGIIGGAKHGYFASCVAILALYPFKGRLRPINIATWALFVVSLFFIQERTAFVVGLLCSIYCLYRISKIQSTQTTFTKHFVRLIAILVLCGITYLLYNTIGSVDTRYTTLGTDTQGRSEYIQNAFDYLMHNPLGGYFEYSASGAMAPHNMFVNAFLWGGVIGGLIVIVLILRQLKEVIAALVHKSNSIPIQVILFATIYLAYTGNSMLHNESMVNGSTIIWVYWAVYLTYTDMWNFQINR